jgi:hypothetical protein
VFSLSDLICLSEHECGSHIFACIGRIVRDELDAHRVALCNCDRVRGIFTRGSVIERAADCLVRSVHANRVDISAASRAGGDALLDVQILEDPGPRHPEGDLVRLRAAVPGREI